VFFVDKEHGQYMLKLKGDVMNNEKLLYGVVGFVLGILISGFFASYAVNGNHGSMMRWMGIRSNGYYGNMMDWNR
jgi:hypothetical protein